MIWWDELATGGEAYVPRFGNKGRSTSILAIAAGWYGLSLVPQRHPDGPSAVSPAARRPVSPASSTSPGVTFTGDIKLDGARTPPQRHGPHRRDEQGALAPPIGVGG